MASLLMPKPDMRGSSYRLVTAPGSVFVRGSLAVDGLPAKNPRRDLRRCWIVLGLPLQNVALEIPGRSGVAERGPTYTENQTAGGDKKPWFSKVGRGRRGAFEGID
jgi:hypothetical protein